MSRRPEIDLRPGGWFITIAAAIILAWAAILGLLGWAVVILIHHITS